MYQKKEEVACKFKKAETDANFNCFYDLVHSVNATKIIFLLQSSAWFAYIVSNFPTSIIFIIPFLFICVTTIYSFYTCSDRALIPLLGTMMITHIFTFFFAIFLFSIGIYSAVVEDVYSKNVINQLNNKETFFFSSSVNGSLINCLQGCLLLLISLFFFWQFIVIKACSNFFIIAKEHPTFCAVSMPPAFLGKLPVCKNQVSHQVKVGDTKSTPASIYCITDTFTFIEHEMENGQLFQQDDDSIPEATVEIQFK